MPIPLQISFRDMEATPALESAIASGAAKLEHVYDRIERCEVTIERPHQRHRSGQHVHVRIVVSIPGPDVIVSHLDDAGHEDAYVAIREAFEVARAQLAQHVDRVRGEMKRRDAR